MGVDAKFKIGDVVKVTKGGEIERKELGEDTFTIEVMHWADNEQVFKGHKHWHYGWKAEGYDHPDGYFYDEENLVLVS